MSIEQSILDRLKNNSLKSGKSFQLLLQLFCQEELLRRVSLSKYVDNLILKGGLFIYTLTNFESRATIDIDFLLKNIVNSRQEILKMINEIISKETGNNYVSYEIKEIKDIALQMKYNGISVQLIAKIKNTRTPLSIDFGIGDIIIPKSEKRFIPTQLEDFDEPEINTYSLESTIAEKFEAMIQRLEFNSRMKDYFDIYYLANTFDFEGRKLQEAIYETIQNRGTPYEANSLKTIVGFNDNNDMNTKWIQFLKKLKLKEPSFKSVLILLKEFIEPIYNSILNEGELQGYWSCKNNKWELK